MANDLRGETILNPSTSLFIRPRSVKQSCADRNSALTKLEKFLILYILLEILTRLERLFIIMAIAQYSDAYCVT